MKEVIQTLKLILMQERRLVWYWVRVYPAVAWALNTAYGVRYGSSPYYVINARALRSTCSTLGSPWRNCGMSYVLNDHTCGSMSVSSLPPGALIAQCVHTSV